MEDRERSREAARRAVALDSRNGEAQIILGDLQSISPSFGCPTAPNPDGAEAAYQEGLRLDRLAGSAYVNLTTHRWWMGQRDKALEAIDDGLAAQPGNVLLKGTRPFNLLFAGRVEEAETLLKQRIDAGARLSPWEEITQAYVALKRRRFDDAAERFKGATVSRTLQGVAVTLITSVAHFESGRPREGGSYLARAVQVAPECAAWAETVPALAPYRTTPEFRQAVRRSSR